MAEDECEVNFDIAGNRGAGDDFHDLGAYIVEHKFDVWYEILEAAKKKDGVEAKITEAQAKFKKEFRNPDDDSDADPEVVDIWLGDFANTDGAKANWNELTPEWKAVLINTLCRFDDSVKAWFNDMAKEMKAKKAAE